MSCSCTKKLNSVSYKGIRYIDGDQKTLPYEICPYCAFKHLAYAFSIAPRSEERAIGELYLALKHLQNNFPYQSEKIIAVINDIISKKYPHIPLTHIMKLADMVHEIVIKYKENNEELPKEEVDIDFDKEMIDPFTVYICAANELFNHEQGYKDINYKFVLGLLQMAVDFAPNEEVKNYVRSAWKMIEAGEDVDLLDLLKINRNKK